MQVYIGIDWSANKHDVCYINEKGGVIEQITIPHSQNGFIQLDEEREKLGISVQESMIGIETAHNILVDHLQRQGYEHIYVIPPHMVNDNRGRFGVSKARTDRSDAHLIADILRTDQGRLLQWRADSLLTQQIRAQVSLIRYLTNNIVRTTNRLRDVLLRYYPQATRIFSLDSLISLQFIRTYPTPEQANQLSFAEFKAFAKENRYCRPKRLPAYYAQLQNDSPKANQVSILVYQYEAPMLAELLTTMVRTKNRAMRELKALFIDHPDYPIFSSLPGAGDFLGPALLSKFGDNRQRFPDKVSMQATAGTCPITRSSGKRKMVIFRRRCDREFRYFVQQWAKESIKQSPWAVTYFESVLPHCSSISHAYRCLANRWLAIAWRLWQDQVPYDEDYHLRQRLLHTRPR